MAPDSTAAAREGIGPIALQVENRGTYEIIVYAVRGSLRQRLTAVPAVSQAAVVVPATFTEDRGGVAFSVRPIAVNTAFTTDRVVPRSGDRLVLTVQARVNQTTLVVE